MDYLADETVQMRRVDELGKDSGLEIHELRGDGHPRCGPKPDKHNGKAMLPINLGRRIVTCGHCATYTGH